ncbi:MAG TPA: VWA domain-containing protein [Actinomycetes bacterium]|nr:VWA domain-containing protein [Actinomycetes bacterium]
MRIGWVGARWRRRAARLCLWLGVALLVLAAARPLAGARAASSDGSLELVADVSGSTMATAVAPTRTGAIQRSTLQLLDQVSPSVRVGLVTFSGRVAVLASPTRGRAGEARSAVELDGVLRDLARRAGVVGEERELSLLFAAAALLLLAVGGALSPRRRSSRRGPTRLAVAWRWAPSAALLAIAGATTAAWVQLVAPGPPPQPVAAASIMSVLSKQSVLQPPAAQPLPYVRIAASERDRPLVERAVALLRRHGELAEQRRAEVRRRQLKQVDLLNLNACDVCKLGPLTRSGGYQTVNGNLIECVALLNTAFIRQQARGWRVDVTALTAMAVLHEQELCLHAGQSTASPVDAEQRLAGKLHDGRLFDRFYAQVEANARDRDTVEQALAIVRDHGELAFQRRDSIRRRHLNQVDPLRITVCHSCRDDRIGEAYTSDGRGDVVACEILVDMAGVRSNARDWGLRVTDVVAVLLTHEQEHCVRSPDDRETPAVDEEARLARKIGKARLVGYVTASYGHLDKSGHWKR